MSYPDYEEIQSDEQLERERATLLGNLYFFATERDGSSFADDCLGYGFDAMPSIFADYGLRWNHLVEHDVTAIFNRQPVKYFKPIWAWMDDYRAAHNIMYKAPTPHLVHVKDLDGWREYMDQIKAEVEEHGISLWMQDDMGYACYREQSYFYKTQDWQNRAAAARYEWDYKCCQCGRSGKGLHVHHTSPIVSAYHYNFDNCFADYRIRLYCEDCHRKTHSMTIRGYGSYCYIGATPAEVAEEKEYFRKWRTAHDKLKQCPFCKARGYFN